MRSPASRRLVSDFDQRGHHLAGFAAAVAKPERGGRRLASSVLERDPSTALVWWDVGCPDGVRNMCVNTMRFKPNYLAERRARRTTARCSEIRLSTRRLRNGSRGHLRHRLCAAVLVSSRIASTNSATLIAARQDLGDRPRRPGALQRPGLRQYRGRFLNPRLNAPDPECGSLLQPMQCVLCLCDVAGRKRERSEETVCKIAMCLGVERVCRYQSVQRAND